MLSKKTRSIIAVGALAAALGLSACSSDTSDTVVETPAAQATTPAPDASAMPDATASATAVPSESMDGGDGTMVGEDPGTWAPIVITEELNEQTVQMVPGQVGIIPVLSSSPEGSIIVETSDPEIVEVMQAEDTGDMQTQPGITAKKVGAATVTVLDGEAPLFTFTVDIVG